jgi:Putative Ig domain
VKVTPFDGTVNGKPILSPPVKIANSPPVIQEVQIEPKVAYANGNLKVIVKSFDVDGDPISYTYQWEKNGAILTEEKNEVLEKGLFKKGDLTAITVTPGDGETSGSAKKSDPITIANSPAIITSSPPDKTDGSIYTYQVNADDPDTDPVVFDIKTAAKGMKINKKTGLLRWEFLKSDHGTHSIEIQASDSEGGKCL